LKENIPNKQRILTFSNSYTIAEVLKNLRDRVIYVCESHPGGEGKVLHEILQGSVLVRDEKGSEMIQHKKIDALIIGCDALTRDVGFINKVGTKVFVSMTRKSQIPVFILTSQLKVTDKLPEITSDLLEEVPWFENMILIIDE
jgi:translation initiation factor 2B subunit (eIF-2B alpha/beta/delta family)